MTDDRSPITAPSPPSVGLVSLGCAKNLVDSQIMAGVLLADDLTLAASPEEADVVLVNTCAFIEPAREESVDAILSACRLKAEGRCRAVVVTGCLPQRYREALRKSLPEVNAFLGLDELDQIGDVVQRALRGEHGILRVSARARRLFDPGRAGVVLTRGPYAYLKIAEGCNHRCAFCAIPMIRGAHRSRPLRSIVREAEQLLEHGIRELDLVSQDVTAYGCDIENGPGLPELLRALGRIGGRFWIRLLYGHPSRLTDRLLDTMAEIPQVCHYLDVPIQHSHPDVLRAMRRAGTVKHVHGMADRIRNVLPDAVLRTTCLVGFPGEKREHFVHLLAFLRETRFDHVGVFVYSPEEHTSAFDLPGRPRRATARRRRRRLMLAQRKIVDRNAAGLIGTRTDALLERRRSDGKGGWIARSPRFAPEVDGEIFVGRVPAARKAGDFIRIRYTAQAGYDMRAIAL